MFKKVKDILFISVPLACKKEFEESIDSINVLRGKFTSVTFIIVEIIMIVFSIIARGHKILVKPDVYYLAMYIFQIIFMAMFFLIFFVQEKEIRRYKRAIYWEGKIFTIVTLLWCMGISLLDQMSSGQIIVYTVGILAVAITPILDPLTVLASYFISQTAFIILIPYFSRSSAFLFGKCINSTGFVIIAWAISFMRYGKYVEDFNNEKLIQIKNNELDRINRELKKANMKLKILSETDGLTGISNRLVFDKTIKEELKKCIQTSTALSLIMVDIDFFKAFNDNYGHQAGDDCLKMISAVLDKSVRDYSGVVAARYGGEEFSIIFENRKKDDMFKIADDIRKRVLDLAIVHEHSSVAKYVTISLGVYTVIPSDKVTVDEFIRASDNALYKAKEERNKVVST